MTSRKSRSCAAPLAILHVCILQTCAEEPVVNHAGDAHASIDRGLIDTLFDRAHKVSSIQHASLCNTVLGKSVQAATPQQVQGSLRRSPPRFTPPSNARYTNMMRPQRTLIAPHAQVVQKVFWPEYATTDLLKQIYIDAVFLYHEKGEKVITDEKFDVLKKELTSRGSGFPSLHRDSIKFVEAYLADSRGEPILSDDEYEQLKSKVFAQGRIEEVAEFLRYIKGMDKFTKAITGSTEQMKEAYIDAVYSYYEKGGNPLTNEEFGKLRKELFRRGHDMSSLHRDDIKFAAAYIANARGEPIVSDDAYERMKIQLKKRGKNKEVNDLVFYISSKKQ